MSPRSRFQAILIAGPTASGKSALAAMLARRLDGVVINADSMQVYDGLRILTARPSPEEEAALPHRLYGHVPPQEAYSAGRYATEAAAAIAEAGARGQMPIIVGGTGLYFKALTVGLSPIPPVPEDIRTHWRDEAKRVGAPVLHEVLRARDPDMAARLRPTDPQRVTRALEVLDATGYSLGYWQQQPGVPVLDAERCLRLVVAPEREALYERCDARFDAMLKTGALAEVSAFAALGLDPELPVMRALGLPPLIAHLSGAIPLDAAVSHAKAATRRYAKRQQTWLSGNMRAWQWLSAQQTECACAGDMAFIDL